MYFKIYILEQKLQTVKTSCRKSLIIKKGSGTGSVAFVEQEQNCGRVSDIKYLSQYIFKYMTFVLWIYLSWGCFSAAFVTLIHVN